ncbi:Hypothetical predicted protein [Olea europaea subsp. europaea]|uniref:Uncharacterized protein n=1 Tax=Olea europaea subsp. europaea TaxID=158383 RepID=A0A8S0P9T5_OLEEU|nr:Hypothetical predicted protein [Olea europaea subsp. europaea]
MNFVKLVRLHGLRIWNDMGLAVAVKRGAFVGGMMRVDLSLVRKVLGSRGMDEEGLEGVVQTISWTEHEVQVVQNRG